MNRPSDFTMEPWDSILHKTEAEIVAVNIMVILKRTGDTWRDLTWEEYKKERLKDGHFSETEEMNFTQVKPFCKSEIEARLFSSDWASVVERTDHELPVLPIRSYKRKIMC